MKRAENENISKSSTLEEINEINELIEIKDNEIHENEDEVSYNIFII